MVKADITERVSRRVRLSKEEAGEMVGIVFETIKEALERGEKVKISGFGNFVVREKKPASAVTPMPALTSRSSPAGWPLSGPATC